MAFQQRRAPSQSLWSPSPVAPAHAAGGEAAASRVEMDPAGAVPDEPVSTPDGLADVREAAEKTYQTDMSDVRFHVGSERADREDARAFTLGNDVFLGGGEPAPGTREGSLLVAHELAHVAQGKARGPGTQSDRSEPGQPAEAEADRAARLVVANLHDGGTGKMTPTQPPAATKMRKKKGGDAGKAPKPPRRWRGGGKYEGYSGVLPGTPTASRMTAESTYVRTWAFLLENQLLGHSGGSGAERAIGLTKEVDKLIRMLKAALEAGKSPVLEVPITVGDTTWTVSGALRVLDMVVVDKEPIRGKHSATSTYEGGDTTTHGDTDTLRLKATLGEETGTVPGPSGGKKDSARAEIEVGGESSMTDSHEATSADTGGIGVDYETDGFAVTYSADVCCDLTLGYVEEDLLYDDHDSKAKDGLPCGRATFTFDEPG